MIKKNFKFLAWIVVVFAVLLAGCGIGDTGTSSQGEKGKDASEATLPDLSEEKATITIFSGVSPELFQETADQYNKKFPNVTFKQVYSSDATERQQIFISAKVDLIDVGITNLLDYTKLDVPVDHDPLVKKYQFDLGQFEPKMIESIRSYSNSKALIALPTSYQPFVLYYNKDIFERFGVPYPKENSTWDELIELSKDVTREVDGIQYHGLNPGLNPARLQTQLSLPFLDEANRSVVAALPGWKTLFQIYKDIYNVPGNFQSDTKITDGTKLFIEDKVLAMYPHLVTASFLQSNINVGVTTFPQFEHIPGVATGVFGQAIAVAKSSEMADLAFQIAMYAVSEEVQVEGQMKGNISPLYENQNVQNKFLDGSELAQVIDPALLFQLKSADPYHVTQWDRDAMLIVRASLHDVISNNVDINTALRETDEKINALIQSSQSK